MFKHLKSQLIEKSPKTKKCINENLFESDAISEMNYEKVLKIKKICKSFSIELLLKLHLEYSPVEKIIMIIFHGRSKEELSSSFINSSW